MAKQKYTFPEPYCPGCQYHQTVGEAVGRTRYCNGFLKRRKSKRFKRSDPKYKPPGWCPRRISPPACRVYGFADRDSELMHWMFNSKDVLSCERTAHISVSERHYRLRLEVSLGMTAKQFYDATQSESLSDIFSRYGAQVERSEIIEIDDGLKPYYFYCMGGFAVVPLVSFDRSRVQPSEPIPSKET